MARTTLVCVYRDEEFITCGTPREVANEFKISINCVYSKISHFKQRREDGMTQRKNAYQWYSFLE
ncbi:MULTISPECIES: hypothetical protein [unclassified Lactococcus]|uniref:hypothetical protein n=1 Tax=unclassified Lactococcus TaxID=2643510 RepID=UPI0011C85D41|nr:MULTISPECIES: hypothetical protein [unclassified Lactococcus]MQW21977.1 hypothetical protein [Lactococcus sp. dk101]TXK36842.1 hypothetical protein FVP42_10725 [Lactococcus sp. dk310]TXK47460.1 hypothetical protein FVP43_10115 [Lactococcus sp. dk322]